jgi:hypothetical protein
LGYVEGLTDARTMLAARFSILLGGRKELESQTRLTVNGHRLQEHGCRSNPEAAFAVERTIDDKLLFRFGMSCDPQHFIFGALIVPIATRLHHRVSFLSDVLL